jgi:hypothetical protein
MNRSNALHTFLRLTLSLSLFMALSMGALAQKGGKEMTKKDIQKMYMDYLKAEGYIPEIDEDGDVRFKREGKTYFISADSTDLECFRLVLANIWEIESEEERDKVRLAMNVCNADAKVAKAYMVRDNVWVAIETFIAKPEDFKAIFKRSISALDYGVSLYVTRMREE